MGATINLTEYDHYLVMFSGGKDSLACLLHLLNLNIPSDKIELWHHLVDGSSNILFDWECTEDYCKKIAHYFGIPIYYSWKEDGFKGELFRMNSSTKTITFETPEGFVTTGGNGPLNTRLKFPQLSANLSVRWCSAYLKIGVGRSAIANQNRFLGKRTLVISGERAEESAARSKQAFLEPDCTDNRNGKTRYRWVDRCRLVLTWTERDIWKIIKKFAVFPHPCYRLGYSRCSCKWCIFGNPDQLATSYYLSPQQGDRLIAIEQELGWTIKPKISLATFIRQGRVFQAVYDNPIVAYESTQPLYTLPIVSSNWQLPAGAFKRQSGPM